MAPFSRRGAFRRRSAAARLQRPAAARRGSLVDRATHRDAADALEPRTLLSAAATDTPTGAPSDAPIANPAAFDPPVNPPVGAGSQLAYYGSGGTLIRPLDACGNRIADFSAAGYRNSDVPLPDVTATIDPSRVITLAPSAGDATARIQAAIDQVGALSLDANGFRGVVQLQAGEYELSDTLEILHSGVVLRGVGDGDDPATSTILRGTDTRQYDLIHVGTVGGFPRTVGPSQAVVQKYVPVGATSLEVADASGFAVGDAILITRPSTQAWIDSLGMDEYGWVAGGNYDQRYERTVTRIEGNRLFYNAPTMHAFDQDFDSTRVAKSTYSERIANVGIENLRGTSNVTSATDEDHARSFIVIREAEDVWVRNITGEHFIYATVHAAAQSIRVTVEDAQSLDPVSQITGGRRYAFTIDGQFVLMRDLFSHDGRHDYVNNSSWRNRGPNVFLDGRASNPNSTVGPHQRYSVGTLYDTISNRRFEAKNAGDQGSGHGWRGANMVFWNNAGNEFTVQNPPGAQNWVIGTTGRIIDEDRYGEQELGIFSEHGSPIDFQDPANPTSSLFVAQHNERLAIPTAERREYVAGDFDLGEYDGAADAADAPADWLADLADLADLAARTTGTVNGFDAGGEGDAAALGFGFRLDARDAVASAVLSIGLRGAADAAGDPLDSSTHTLHLDDLSAGRTLGSLGLASPLATDETTTLTLQLAGDDLAMLADGQLNLALAGGSNVDWAVLDLRVDTEGLDDNLPPTIDDAAFTLTEGAAAGTLVGTVAASDPNAGQTISLAIVAGNADGAFAIDGDGRLTVADAAALDFETAPQRTLTVTATDDADPALSADATVTVSLLDNDTAFAVITADGDLHIEGTAGDDSLRIRRQTHGVAQPTLQVWSRQGLQFGGQQTAGRWVDVAVAEASGGFAGDVTIETGEGENRVHISRAVFEGSVSITGGTRADLLVVANTIVDGSLSIASKNGDDRLVGSWVRVAGPTDIDAGWGRDRTHITRSDFADALTLTDRNGDGTLRVHRTSVGGALAVSTGTAAHRVRLSYGTFAGPVTIDATGYSSAGTPRDLFAGLYHSQIGGALTLVGSGGRDSFALRGVAVAGATVVELGHGENGFDARRSVFGTDAADALTILGGDDDDRVRLHVVTHAGEKTLDLGGGANLLREHLVTDARNGTT